MQPTSFDTKPGAVRVVGSGTLTGAGRGLESLWRALVSARPLQAAHGIGDGRLDGAQYVAAGEPRRADGDLPTAWLQLACEDALAGARPVLERMQSPRLALLSGSSLGGISLLERAHRRWWDGSGAAGPGLPVSDAPAWRALYDGPANEVGRRLAAGAGAWSVNTACSSAANAIGLARRWLLRGRADAVVVAGLDVVSPFVLAGFQCLGAVDAEPSTPFGAERHGLNLGEAAVAFVLTRLEDAFDIEGTLDVVGYGSSCDAHHLTRPDPSGAGLARAVRRALADAGREPRDVGLLSAHGTGTAFNDAMEAAAFVSVFGDAIPPVHCAKPVTGHTLGAAGAVDMLAVMLMLRHATLPATYLRGEEDAALACHPERHGRPLDPGVLALSTSSGFGGSNAALLLERSGR